MDFPVEDNPKDNGEVKPGVSRAGMRGLADAGTRKGVMRKPLDGHAGPMT